MTNSGRGTNGAKGAEVASRLYILIVKVSTKFMFHDTQISPVLIYGHEKKNMSNTELLYVLK